MAKSAKRSVVKLTSPRGTHEVTEKVYAESKDFLAKEGYTRMAPAAVKKAHIAAGGEVISS